MFDTRANSARPTTSTTAGQNDPETAMAVSSTTPQSASQPAPEPQNPPQPPTTTSEIPLKKIVNASSIKLEYFEKFVADLILLLDKRGLPYHQKEIEIPQGKKFIFYGNPRDKNTLPQDIQKTSDSYLFFADLVNIIGQVAEWYFDNGNAKAKEILKPVLPYVRDEKILQNIFGSDHVLDDSTVGLGFYKILPIINRLLVAADVNSDGGIEGLENSDYLLEQKKKFEEQVRDAEKNIAVPTDDFVGGRATQPTPEDGGSATEATTLNLETPQEEPIHGLKISDLKTIETEVAWISSPIVYSLFGRHGISYEVLNQYPELMQELYEHVRKTYLESTSKSRVEIFHQAIISLPPEFLIKLEAFYKQYSLGLTPEEQAVFLESIQQNQDLFESKTPAPLYTSEVFRRDISSILNTDSTVVVDNVKNSVESLIIAYGAPLQIVSDDGVSAGMIRPDPIEKQPKNSLDIIKNLPDGYLKLIFGIDPNQKLTTEQVKKLRLVLLGYAEQRIIELALTANSETITQGVLETDVISQLSKPGQKNRYPSLATTMPGFETIREDVATHGGEVVARAFSSRDRLAREIALWNQLSDREKEIAAKYAGVNPDEVIDWAVPPEKTRFFKIAELSIFAKEEVVRQNQALANYFEEQKQISTELALRESYLKSIREAIGEEELLLLEQYYDAQRAMLVANLNAELAVEQQALLSDYLAGLAGLDEYSGFVGGNFADLSPQELLQLHDDYESYTADGGVVGAGQTPSSGVVGRRSRRSGGRADGGRIRNLFSKKVKDKTDIRQKLSKELAKKKIVKTAQKKVEDLLATAAAKTGLVGAAAGFALKHKKTAGAAIGLFVGTLIGGLIKMFNGGVWGLAGGIIGGIAGGIVGSFASPLGAAVGATLGASAGGALGAWAGSKYGGLKPLSLGSTGAGTGIGAGAFAPTITQNQAGAASQLPQGASVAGETTATATTTATIAQTLATAPVAVLAPLGMLVVTSVLSISVIFIIMSAFLVPIPTGYDFKNLPSLPPGLNPCWPTTGTVTQLAVPGHNGIYKVNDITQSIDIACAAGSCPRGDLGGWPPKVYASHNGTVQLLKDYSDDTDKAAHGNYIIITSPDGFKTLYGHLDSFAPGLSTGDVVGRGQFIAYMGNEGKSSGTHLHYEYSGGLISSILPMGEYKVGQYVLENCSTGGVPVGNQTGYLAIGPLNSGNVVASTTNDIANPTPTCSWQGTKNLEVAVNANFFNQNGKPVGYAGEGGDVKYYEDSETSEAFMNQLSTLVDNSGSFTIVSGKNRDPDNWTMAVTGFYTKGESSNNTPRPRTILGIGTANSNCSKKYAGQRVLFLAVMPEATFDQIEKELSSCGATQVVHMDGGGSSAFCSAGLTHPSSRSVPVSIGMQEAEIGTFGGDGSSAPPPVPTPSDLPLPPI